MRNNYAKQLEDLKKELILMGSLCENMLKDALDAFEQNDDTKASVIAESDDKIDNKESEIEALCLSLILHQQPVASERKLQRTVRNGQTDSKNVQRSYRLVRKIRH